MENKETKQLEQEIDSLLDELFNGKNTAQLEVIGLKVDKIIEQKKIEFPKEIKISNLEDMRFELPRPVIDKVEFPKKMEVDFPENLKKLSTDTIEDAFTKAMTPAIEKLIKAVERNVETRLMNKLPNEASPVRLVTQQPGQGMKFYDGPFGGGGGGTTGIARAVSIKSGQVTVTTAGTEVQMPSNNVVWCLISALSTNTGKMYVGNDGANAVSSTTGFELSAGQTVGVDIDNTNKIWIDSSVNGEKVCWIAGIEGSFT